MTAPTADRYHALDSLRGFAMFLGVVLHAAISFATVTPVFWSIRDRDPSGLVDVFLFATHTFRMQLFFLLAGFFGCLLYARYGLGGMVKHRAKRVLVPLLLAVPLVIPSVLAIFLYAGLVTARAEGVPESAGEFRERCAKLIAANPGQSDLEIVVGRFTSGEFLAAIVPAHLWFLYYLLWFYFAVVALAPLGRMLDGTRLLAASEARFRRLVESRWCAAVPAVLTLPLLLTMRTPVVDTPMSWVPDVHLLAYYFCFFAFGWVLYRHRDLVTAFGRGWRVHLVAANVLVLPAGLVALFAVVGGLKEGRTDLFGLRLTAFALQSAYTWLMIVGLWGAFLHYFSRERAWVRYLADSAYWCYLASITPILLLQFWVRNWALPGLLKWALITVVAMAFLLVTYQLFVRYTFVGAILNGRKTRAKVPAAPPAPVTADG